MYSAGMHRIVGRTALAGCFACLVSATTLAGDHESPEQNAPTHDASETVQVQNALLKTIEATNVAAEVAGKLSQMMVVEGDHVRVGQPLGKVRDDAVRLQLERSKVSMAIARRKHRTDIDLRLAEKKSEVAQGELERAENANTRIPNTYPPKEMERLRLVATSADLEVERAKHEKELLGLDVMMAENEYRQAAELLARHDILSPADGVVVSVNHRVGEWVEPGSELLQIVKIDRLRIEGFIDAAAISKQLVHQAAQVTVLKGKEHRQITGKVVFVSPDTNPVNGQVRVYLEIDNKQGEFRPGMRVRASITPREP